MAETLVNLVIAIGIAFLPLIITAVRLNNRRLAAKQAAQQEAADGAGTQADKQPGALRKRLQEGLKEFGIYMLGDSAAVSKAQAEARAPIPPADSRRGKHDTQRNTPLAGLSPDMIYRRGSGSGIGSGSGSATPRRRSIPGQYIRPASTSTKEMPRATGTSSLDRIDRYSRLKQAVVWAEVLGPPRGLS